MCSEAVTLLQHRQLLLSPVDYRMAVERGRAARLRGAGGAAGDTGEGGRTGKRRCCSKQFNYLKQE